MAMQFHTPESGDPLEALLMGQKFGQNLFEHPQKLQQMKLANALEEYKRQQEAARSPFYGNFAQSENDLAMLAPQEHKQKMQHIAQEMQYNPRRWESEMAQQGAQTNRINTMTPLEANELKLKNQFYPDLTRSQIESNKSLAKQREMGGSAMGGVSGQTLALLQKQIQMENPNFTPEQINDAANAYIEGRNSLSDGTPLRPAGGIISSQLDNISKQRYTSDALNQNRYAKTLDTILVEGEKLMPSVAKYSSLIGTAKGSIDKVTEALGGQGSPDYQNYINFTRTLVPSMAGEFLRTLGAGATDKQKEMMVKMADPTYFDRNPKTAINTFNYLADLYKNKISPSIRQPTHQTMLPGEKISNAIGQGTQQSPIKLIRQGDRLVRAS